MTAQGVSASSRPLHNLTSLKVCRDGPLGAREIPNAQTSIQRSGDKASSIGREGNAAKSREIPVRRMNISPMCS